MSVEIKYPERRSMDLPPIDRPFLLEIDGDRYLVVRVEIPGSGDDDLILILGGPGEPGKPFGFGDSFLLSCIQDYLRIGTASVLGEVDLRIEVLERGSL